MTAGLPFGIQGKELGLLGHVQTGAREMKVRCRKDDPSIAQTAHFVIDIEQQAGQIVGVGSYFDPARRVEDAASSKRTQAEI